MRFISLDISTTTIGIAVFDGLKLIHYEYYKPNKKIEQIDMLIEARDHISAIIRSHEVEEFVVEDYIRYMKGQSGASTIIPLAILNTTLKFMARDMFGFEPHCLNVLKIRHALKLDKKLPLKEDIPDLVEYHLGIELDWPLSKRGKNKGKKATEAYDIADAIAVGLAWIKINEYI